MNKEIINGVDVSGCIHTDNRGRCYAYYVENEDSWIMCEDTPNCYYKQLQKLKHQYADVLKLAKENADSNEYCLQELEQENKRIKEENKQLKKLKFKSDGIELLQDANLNLHNANVKYRTTLREIREDIKNCNNGKCLSCKYNSNDLDNCRDKMDDLIIDKINEVIGAE